MRLRWVGLLVSCVRAAGAGPDSLRDRSHDRRATARPEHGVPDSAQSRGRGAQWRCSRRTREQGYSRVRVADQGTEGWILTRFLMPEPIARERLAVDGAEPRGGARARRRRSRGRTSGLTRDLAADARRSSQQTRTNHGTVSQELADIAHRCGERRRDSRPEHAPAAASHSARPRGRRADGRRTRACAGRNNQNWFIVGAGVLLGGIVIGLVAPSLRRKRRSDW